MIANAYIRTTLKQNKMALTIRLTEDQTNRLEAIKNTLGIGTSSKTVTELIARFYEWEVEKQNLKEELRLLKDMYGYKEREYNRLMCDIDDLRDALYKRGRYADQ